MLLRGKKEYKSIFFLIFHKKYQQIVSTKRVHKKYPQKVSTKAKGERKVNKRGADGEQQGRGI